MLSIPARMYRELDATLFVGRMIKPAKAMSTTKVMSMAIPLIDSCVCWMMIGLHQCKKVGYAEFNA